MSEPPRGSSFLVDLRPLEKRPAVPAAPESFFLKDDKTSPNFLEGIDGRKTTARRGAPRLKRHLARKLKREERLLMKKSRQEKQSWKRHFHNFQKASAAYWRNKYQEFDRALAGGKFNLASKRRRQTFPWRTKERTPWQLTWYRSLFSFLVALILLVIPFKLISAFHIFNLDSWKNKIMASSQLAVNDLLSASAAASKFDLAGAQNKFASAGAAFLQADEDMSEINGTLLSLAALSSDPKLKLAAESKRILKCGVLASDLGNELTQALGGLSDKDGNWMALLDNFSLYGNKALADSRALAAELSKINPDNLPAEYRDRFTDLSAKVVQLPENLAPVMDNVDKLKTFLGAGRDKRYLLVFQNNAEMRGSGGFLGSYALVDFREGKIRDLEVPGGGSYDTEAGLKDKIKAPQPLWLVNPQWHFWDANWWPDWPTTAQNLMWFYEKSDGPSVDGVISFTPSVVEKLLTVTGPIDLTKDYGLVITADNFWQEVELTTERDNLVKDNPEAVAHLPQGQKGKPKKIIGDLMAKILEVLPQKIDKDNLIKLLNISEDSLASKQIMFYFKDNTLEDPVLRHNWGGAMTAAPLDYLMVTNTNIAGAKTDRVIKESISHQAKIASDGSIVDTVTITRTHTAAKNTPLVGVRNVDWIRVYVPQGSQLVAATGFVSPDSKYFKAPDPSWEDNKMVAQTENLAVTDKVSGTRIYQENGKTVLANWLMLDPGTSATVTLQYKLPFNFWQKAAKTDFMSRLNAWLNPSAGSLFPYSILVQKQPGADGADFSTELIPPSFAKLVWDSTGEATNNWKHSLVLDRDQFFSLLLTNK